LPLQAINNEGINPAERLNYFNYFTEVEEEFVRRRGKPLMISPIDWALVESWKSAGIPLHIVLRAINEAFDGYDARAQKYRKVNSIFYCQQAVEAAFAEYRLSQVGGGARDQVPEDPGSEPKSPRTQREEDAFPKDVLLDFLARCDEELSAAGQSDHPEMNEAIARARARLKEIAADIEGSKQVLAESIERDLDAIDRMILESASIACGEEEMKKIRAEAQSQLRSYRKKMDKAIYETTVLNFVSRRLREINKIPRLSLFYL
jgi:ElaB/YqjD/DUF883 family membrane-anchored ribosome-binding protein